MSEESLIRYQEDDWEQVRAAAEVARRTGAEFTSVPRRNRYRVTSVEAGQIEVERLDAHQPQVLTRADVLRGLRSGGSLPFCGSYGIRKRRGRSRRSMTTAVRSAGSAWRALEAPMQKPHISVLLDARVTGPMR